jgi:hypothetical protein
MQAAPDGRRKLVHRRKTRAGAQRIFFDIGDQDWHLTSQEKRAPFSKQRRMT